jgi:hypothetical protein
MPLFDDRERTDRSPSPISEDQSAFLSRSDRADAVNIRAELERWFDRYPAAEQSDLRSKFRDPRNHLSAWWELYLHELFIRLEFQVEVHPELSDVTTRPDFKMTGPVGVFLLEAATTEAGIAEPGRDGTREGWIIDALNAAPHPDFFISLRFVAVGQQRPRNSEVTRPVTAWLDGLDADQILATNQLPERDFTFRGWTIHSRAIPKSSASRGVHEGDPLIGMGPSASGQVNDRERMLGKLRDKSGKYGNPELPIVVAVNLRSTFGLEDEVEQALFGSIAVRVPIGAGPSAADLIRQQDGFWFRDGRPLATRVSAVLAGPALGPWTVGRDWPRLWLNPWAAQPLDVDLPVPQRVADTAGHVAYHEARGTPAALFGFPAGWPGPMA